MRADDLSDIPLLFVGFECHFQVCHKRTEDQNVCMVTPLSVIDLPLHCGFFALLSGEPVCEGWWRCGAFNRSRICRFMLLPCLQPHACPASNFWWHFSNYCIYYPWVFILHRILYREICAFFYILPMFNFITFSLHRRKLPADHCISH